jgi:hypothetical protein
MALPIKVGIKNFLNGILKCPHVIPAKSNKGFGIEALNKIVMKPYFYMLSKIIILALSIKDKFYFFFNSLISAIY